MQMRASALELSNVERVAPSKKQKSYEIGSVLFRQSAGGCSAAIEVPQEAGTAK